MDIRKLQDEVNARWGSQDHNLCHTSSTNHALVHLMKALGKVASEVNDAEHEKRLPNSDVAKYLADLVICAARFAHGCKIDLGIATGKRLEDKFPKQQALLKIGDVVRFKATGAVCKVDRFVFDEDTTAMDFIADNGTGPYKQIDVEKLDVVGPSEFPAQQEVYGIYDLAEHRWWSMRFHSRTAAQRHLDGSNLSTSLTTEVRKWSPIEETESVMRDSAGYPVKR